MTDMKEKMAELLTRQEEERTLLAKDLLAPLVELTVKRTHDWAEKNGLDKDEESKLSSRGPAIALFLEREDFGCHQGRVQELCSLLLGEEIPSLERYAVEHVVGVAVVPLGCTNSHNYKVGEPAICYEKRLDGATRFLSRIRQGKDEGNSMEYMSRALRPATPQEIADLLLVLFNSKNKTATSVLLSLMEDSVTP